MQLSNQFFVLRIKIPILSYHCTWCALRFQKKSRRTGFFPLCVSGGDDTVYQNETLGYKSVFDVQGTLSYLSGHPSDRVLPLGNEKGSSGKWLPNEVQSISFTRGWVRHRFVSKKTTQALSPRERGCGERFFLDYFEETRTGVIKKIRPCRMSHSYFLRTHLALDFRLSIIRKPQGIA